MVKLHQLFAKASKIHSSLELIPSPTCHYHKIISDKFVALVLLHLLP